MHSDRLAVHLGDSQLEISECWIPSRVDAFGFAGSRISGRIHGSRRVALLLQHGKIGLRIVVRVYVDYQVVHHGVPAPASSSPARLRCASSAHGRVAVWNVEFEEVRTTRIAVQAVLVAARKERRLSERDP